MGMADWMASPRPARKQHVRLMRDAQSFGQGWLNARGAYVNLQAADRDSIAERTMLRANEKSRTIAQVDQEAQLGSGEIDHLCVTPAGFVARGPRPHRPHLLHLEQELTRRRLAMAESAGDRHNRGLLRSAVSPG